MVNHTKPKKTLLSSESRKISQRKSSKQQLSAIQAAATQAQAAYQWEKALPLYTQALVVARRGKPPISRSAQQTEYDLLDGQAECYRNLGDFASESGALETMVELARQLEDPARQVRALVRRAVTSIRLGNLPNGQQFAELALELARQPSNLPEATRRKLEADSLFHLGDILLRLGDYSQAKVVEEQALELCRQLGDQAGEAHALWGLGFVEIRSGQYTQTAEYFTRSLELSRRTGDREGMGNALNGLSIVTKDLALARTYLEQALAAFEATGNRERQTMIHNNLSVGYQTLGMYRRAVLELEPAIEIARQMKARQSLVYYLGNLGDALQALGEYERARLLFQEALELAIESGERKMIANNILFLGLIQLLSGHPDEAVQLFLDAGEKGLSLDIPENAWGMAWLSAAYLAQGNLDLAGQAISQALNYLQTHGNTTGEMPLNEFWWLRYKTLSALTSQSPRPDLREESENLGELAWQALDQAREAMLAPIASLSDDGLRRNCFNKVSANRQIIQEWLHMASERGLPLNPLTDHFSQPGDLQGQLQRMLDIGVRLNSGRDTQDLPHFIMDEVVELTGADRARLYLMDESGKRQLAAEVIPPSPQPTPKSGEGERKNEEQLLDETFLKRAPLLRYIPEHAPELEQHSILCVPLIAQDRLVGLVYTELSGIYGRFTALDRDLLTVLANQAAVAIENANWAGNLEQRVEQRTAELALINRVQQALAAQLDRQAIIDLVGEEIRKLFDAQIFQVVHYDPETDLCYWLYSSVDGERETVPPGPKQSLSGYILQTHQPLLINQDLRKRSAELGGIGSGPQTKSYLGVPILIGEEARGVISLQNTIHENAFSESDLHLLTTLANSMGVALENARLFDETMRLLAETEQRAAELAMVNSIQQGLSAQLEMQAIYELVGDKIVQIFDAQSFLITTYDLTRHKMILRYASEKGQRYFDDIEHPITQMGEYIIRTRQPVLFNREADQRMAELGSSENVPGTESPKSALFVQLIAGTEVRGVISLQNVDHEDAFSESDVRLLTTLANSMSVALENARLFNESKRLLAETEQRASELALINSVQEGLAAQLEMQAIFNLVGDKIRQIFNAQVVVIKTFNLTQRTIQQRYAYEKGQSFGTDQELPFNKLIERLIQTRQPVLINRGADQQVRELGLTIIDDTESPKSMLFVPLVVGEQTKGMISLQNIDQEQAFSESDVRLLTTLANSMSVALENARLFDETRRLLGETEQRNAELAIINSVQAALAAELNIQGIYDTVGDKIREIFHNRDLGIRVYDPKTGIIHFPYQYENGQRITIEPTLLAEKGFAAHVLRTRETLVINENIEQETEKYGSYILPGSEPEKSSVYVPLVVGDQARGLINLVDMEHEHAFSESDVRLLQTLANSMSVALENARLFDETQRLLAETEQRNAELAILNRVQEGLVKQLDFQSIINLVGDEIMRVIPPPQEKSDVYSVYIAMYDSQTQMISFPYWTSGTGNHFQVLPVTLGTGLTSTVIQSRQPLVLKNWNDSQSTGGVIIDDGKPDEFAESWLGVPILISDRVTGVICVQDPRPNLFSESDVRLLSTLAASLGVALENARLFDETKRLLKETEQHATELAILNSVSEAMSKTLDVKTLTRIVGDKVRDIFVANSVQINLLDAQTNLIHPQYEFDNGEGGYIDYVQPFPLGTGLTSKVISSQRPLLLGTPEQLAANGAYFPPEVVEQGSGIHSQSYLGVPIIANDRVLGVIALGDYQPHAYNENHLHLLQTLSSSMGVALENARLFQAEQQRVAELAIINSVQAALAAELNIQGIYDTVGDKIREIFHNTDLNIRIYDPKTNLEHFPYIYENGERITVKSDPMSEKGISAYVYRERETLVINENILQEIEKYGSYTIPGTQAEKSAVFVPLVVGDQVRGLINLTNMEREHAFSEADVRLLQTLANSMSVALENARLFDETQRLLVETQQRTAELEIINRMGMALARQLDYEAIVALVGERLREIFPGQMCSIALYNKATDTISWPYFADFDGQQISQQPVALGEGLTSHVIHSLQPLVLGSLEEAEPYGAVWVYDEAEQEPKSWIGVPILVSDEAMGVLAVQDLPKNRYSENDVRLLATLAASMGVALENARLFEETRRLLAETEQRASEMAALAEIGSDIASIHELKPVLERLVVRTKELLNVSDIALFMVEPGGETLRAEVALGKYADEIKATVLQIGEGIIGDNALQGRSEIIQHPDRDSRTIHIPGTPEEDDYAEGLMCAPLISRNKVIGMIGVWRQHADGLFAQAELDFLVSLARQAAIAIESARLYMETERRASQMATIAEVGRELSATLDLQQVVESVAGHAHRLFHARDTILRLVEPDGQHLRTVVALGTYPDQFTVDIIPIGEGITGSIAQTGIAEVINDVAHDARGVHVSGTPDNEEEPETLMVAPLIAQGRTVGTLSVYHSQREGLFTQVDLDFLVGLGRQAAIAIENARLFSEVRSQKQFSESLVQNSPVAIVTANNQYIVTSWNQGAERLFGYNAHEVTGRDLNQLVAYQPDLYAEATAYDTQTSGGEAVHSITRRCRKDGSLVDVELSGVPVIVDGEPTGVIAIYHDITELKRAEAEILESQRRLASIIDFLPDATLVIDQQGKVIAWNRAIEEMTGIKAEEMLGKGNYEYAIPFYGERRPILVDLVFHPWDELEKNYASVQRQGEVLIGETYVSGLKGGGHYLLGTASLLRDSSGQISGAIEIIRDISERKVAEEELQKAKAAAESANQAKSAFLATMSHEIRTPMNAIIGMSGLLMDTPLNAEQRDFAETIRSSGDALLTIINDILDFSKIDAGKMVLEEQPFDLRECLETSLDLVRLQASEKGLELAYLVGPEVPQAITGDVTRLRQILINLLNNAVKFTEQGEVVLSVSSQPVSQSKDGEPSDLHLIKPDTGTPGSVSLQFSVRDTGIGIPPERLDRLFQAFSQADASTTRRYGGTGLGLAISKRLCEMMGGRMWGESEGVPGKGCTFHFSIRASVAKEIKTRPHLSGEQPQLRGKRILIVDDNATNCRILTLQTKNWGLVPRDTEAPSKALEWLRRGDPFDLAILDLQMPEMNGLELASEIRKMRDEKALPLVLSSSLGIREAGVEAGIFRGFLIKPIRPSALFDTLMTILSAGEQKIEETTPIAPSLDPEMAAQHPLHILIAEDNVVNQKLALRLLSQMGYRADVAANGLEAIRSLERQPYDVILMDVQMPEMDGLEASRQICARWPRDVRPRIIAMTANAMQGDREMCLEAGMDDYISKPVRVNELVSALSKAMPIKKGNDVHENPRNLE